jgi:hypothetical protein
MKSKGKTFEKEIYSFIKQELENGNLGLMPDLCKVYMNKKYKDNYREIEIDVSIEVFNKNFPDKPSFYYLIECKNNNRPVDAPKIETFRQQFFDITNGNGKAIFASTSGFSKDATKQAIGLGIGLIGKIGKDIILKAPAKIIGIGMPVIPLISYGVGRIVQNRKQKSKEEKLKQSIKNSIINNSEKIILVSN